MRGENDLQDDLVSRLLDGRADPAADIARAGLREIVALRSALASLESKLVVEARHGGHSWREVGEDLGLSAAGARKRHLAVDPPRERRPYREPTLAEALAAIAAPDRT